MKFTSCFTFVLDLMKLDVGFSTTIISINVVGLFYISIYIYMCAWNFYEIYYKLILKNSRFFLNFVTKSCSRKQSPLLLLEDISVTLNTYINTSVGVTMYLTMVHYNLQILFRTSSFV